MSGTKHISSYSPLRAGLFALASFAVSAALMTSAAQEDNRPKADVDYSTFQTLTDEAAAHRETRLIGLDTFKQMAAREDVIVLDTRSKEAFDQGHFKGAFHLNFSDFTDDKLAEIIPDFDTPILIYCNNNFSDNIDPVPVKRAPLALNIPTFINLYGYGYTNIYELSDLVSMQELGADWVATPVSQ